MFKSQTAKRFRAVMIALAITLFTNYAISFAAKSNTPAQQNSAGLQTQTAFRSGDGPPSPPPRP
jgi:hypothetical protein